MSIVMCRAPFRISFFGGGSDYPEWYRHEGGAVLSTAIDKYIYISCRYLPPFLGTKHRVVWRYVEQVELDCRNSPSGRARGSALSRFR